MARNIEELMAHLNSAQQSLGSAKAMMKNDLGQLDEIDFEIVHDTLVSLLEAVDSLGFALAYSQFKDNPVILAMFKKNFVIKK